MSTFHAYCDRRGVIKTGSRIANGCLPIADDPDRALLREMVEALARHAYDGRTLLVPGIPEAETEQEALTALLAFRGHMTQALSRRAEVAP